MVIGGNGDLRTKLMQKRSLRASMRADLNKERSALPLAFIRELAAVARATTRLAYVRLPLAVGKSLVADPVLENTATRARALEVIGNALLDYINELGPIYGKAGQMALSRLDPRQQELAAALQLDRLYGQWPALEPGEVMAILDREVPEWRKHLRRIDPVPLGVASISQAHAAVGQDGRDWVIKVIKPDAHRRLTTTVDAMEQVLGLIDPLAVTRAARKAVEEAREVCQSYRGELSLRRELDTIQRVRAAMNDGRKQQLLRVPGVMEECSSDRVLVVERFRGTLLSDVVSGRATIEPARRSLLARKVLQDLLVQVFELGLFHADPHAGNLILMEDGTVGLFDWGLTGELLPSDRRHIAAVLRSVISVDFDGLVGALAGIAEDAGREVDRKQIAKELRGFADGLKKEKNTKKSPSQKSSSQKSPSQKSASLHQLLDQSLRAADRLGIPVPSGLLMMAKTLVTVEGLARGIDPDIKLAYAATPVLLRVARPGIGDLIKLAGKLPTILRQFSKIVLFTAGLTGLGAISSALFPGNAAAATAIVGDGVAGGSATHPAVSYDPRVIWKIMSGEVAIAGRKSDIPGALSWNIAEENPRAPKILGPGPAEYRGAWMDVLGALIQSGSNLFFSTPQYAWGYLLARKSGDDPADIILAAKSGARMEDAAALAWRVARETGSGARAPLRRVLMLLGNNDVCASSFEAMTAPAEFRQAALDGLRVFNELQRHASTPLEVAVMQPLPMVQLVTNESVLGKKIFAFGEETTCRELQSRMFLPKKAMDLGDGPEARQVALISQFLPPNPALLCPTLFGRIPEAGDRPAKIGNRLRALRDALAEAVNDATKEASRSGLEGKISFKLIDASAAIQWTADDIAADCFHLSAKGQETLARAIMTGL